MRVELSQVINIGGSKGKSKTGAFLDSLKEGDVVKAEVLSSDKGMVSLKAEGGPIVKARLDGDAAFSVGDKVAFEVTGREEGTVLLSVTAEETGRAAGESAAVKNFEDKSLAPYAEKLAELKMPVRESAARVMRELIGQNPEIGLDEAAFLAANKLSGDTQLVKAALALLSDGVKTDELMETILKLLADIVPEGSSAEGVVQQSLADTGNSQNAAMQSNLTAENLQNTPQQQDALQAQNGVPVQNAPQAQNGVPVQDAPQAQNGVPVQNAPQAQNGVAVQNAPQAQNAAPAQNAPQPQNTAPSQNTAPATLRSFISSIAEAAGQTGDTASQTSETTAGSIISHNDTIMQNENMRQNSTMLDKNSLTQSGGSLYSKIITHNDSKMQNEIFIQEPHHDGDTSHKPENTQSRSPENSQSTAVAVKSDADGRNNTAEIGKAIANVLSEMPEFKNTAAPALEKFSSMLLAAAKDSAAISEETPQKLAELLEKLFTKLEKSDEQSGQKLRQAKEELFVRLSLAEEAVSQTAMPAKTELLEQTRKLMDHVRLLNGIEQYVYMQLPVKMGGEHKTADVYLYKNKKNGKSIDPEDVNILLALDLDNVGHWESFINIKGKEVSIRMEVAGEAEKDFFSENTVMLHTLLAEAGFKLGSTSITHSMPETTPLTALNTLSRHKQGYGGGINFTI